MGPPSLVYLGIKEIYKSYIDINSSPPAQLRGGPWDSSRKGLDLVPAKNLSESGGITKSLILIQKVEIRTF